MAGEISTRFTITIASDVGFVLVHDPREGSTAKEHDGSINHSAKGSSQKGTLGVRERDRQGRINTGKSGTVS